jgi:hypothetical protein
MNKHFILLSLFLIHFLFGISQNNIGIGTVTPNANAILHIDATDKGLLIPRLSNAQRTALTLTNVEAGLLVYGSDNNLFYYWDGTQWIPFPDAGSIPAYNISLNYDVISNVLSLEDGGGTLTTTIPLPPPAFNTAVTFDPNTGELSITDAGGTLTTTVTSAPDDDWQRTNGVLNPITLTDKVAVGGTTAHPSALVDFQSTTTGFLVPRMTTAQRSAIANPAAGLEVFDTDAGVKIFYNGTRWLEVGGDPIGTIKAWHKSFPNTPALPWGWVECNGQAINDAASPYNGSNTPDLNNTFTSESGTISAAGRFLRGGTTSGVSVVDQANNLAQIGSSGNNGCGTCDAVVPQDGTWPVNTPGYNRSNSNTSMRVSHRGVENFPGNMTVVYIFRIK